MVINTVMSFRNRGAGGHRPFPVPVKQPVQAIRPRPKIVNISRDGMARRESDLAAKEKDREAAREASANLGSAVSALEAANAANALLEKRNAALEKRVAELEEELAVLRATSLKKVESGPAIVECVPAEPPPPLAQIAAKGKKKRRKHAKAVETAPSEVSVDTSTAPAAPEFPMHT